MSNFLRDLKPVELKPDNVFHRETTIESQLHDEYVWAMKGRLGMMVARPDFDASAVPAAFADAMDQHSPFVLREVLVREQSPYNEQQPLIRRMGDAAVAASAVQDMMPEPEFVEQLKSQLTPDSLNFSRLQELHSQLPPKFLEAAQVIQELEQSGDPEWADRAYELVDALINDSENVVLSRDRLEALYALCYFADTPRQLLRRAIINTTVLHAVKESVGDNLSTDDQETLQALENTLIGDAMSGQHWTELYLNDENAKRATLYGMAEFDGIATLEKKVNDGTGEHVVQVWRELTDSQGPLNQAIRSAQRMGNGPPEAWTRWELQDTGHCFHNFHPFGLFGIVRESGLGKIYDNKNLRKNDTKAVILEDDSQQMRLWRSAVEKHMAQGVSDETCSDNPADVLAYAEDPTVTLFLIDIENFGDKTAGVNIGEALLKKRLDMRQSHPDLQTKIIVWSTSKRLADQASEYFHQMLDGQEGVSYSLLGRPGRSWSGNPISFDVRTKNLYPVDLV